MIRISARKYKSDFRNALAFAYAGEGSKDSSNRKSALPVVPMPNENWSLLGLETIPASLPLIGEQQHNNVYNNSYSSDTTAAVATTTTTTTSTTTTTTIHTTTTTTITTTSTPTTSAATTDVINNPQLRLSSLSGGSPQQPMLARPIKTFADLERTFDPSLHIVETKYDGERLLHDTRTRVSYTRTLKTPPLVPVRFQVQLRWPHVHALLDGERVFLSSSSPSLLLSDGRSNGDDGFDVSSSKATMLALCDAKKRARLCQCYVIFDIQALDGRSVTHEPLSVRRRLLERCVDVSASQNTRLSDWRTFNSAGELRRFYDRYVTHGTHEGLILKRLDEPYLPNRREWWKIKPLHLRDRRCEVDLVAYSAARDKNGSLRVLRCGYYRNNVTAATAAASDNDASNTHDHGNDNGDGDGDCDDIVHVCRVSSGLREADLARLNVLCDPSSPNGQFYRPVVVVLTADKVTVARNSLRHPVFLRFDATKDPRDVRSIRFE